MDELDIYQRLFRKMAKIGFPNEFEGEKINYHWRSHQADVEENLLLLKINKMWRLCDGEK